MKEKWKKGFALVLSLTSFALVGCNGSSTSNVDSSSLAEQTDAKIDFSVQASKDGVPTYASAKDFTLGAWFSPDDKDELWQWYAESGLNEVTFFPSNKQTKDYFNKALQYCRQHNINPVVNMNGATTLFSSKEDIAMVLKNDKDIVKRFDLYDEPVMDKSIATDSFGVHSRSEFADLVPLVEYVTTNFPDAEMFSTLFPNYANNAALGIPANQTYEDYVKGYCDTVLSVFPDGAKKWLGTDFYPYYNNRFDYGLLSNLEILQKYAQQQDASVFLYIQTMDSVKLDWRLPDYTELSLQYYTALAYGVENIQMFCFQQPGTAHGFGVEDGKAMITDGYVYEGVYERTQVYYDVQKLNGHINGLQKAYMDFDWQGVLVGVGTEHGKADAFTKLKYDMVSYDGIKSYTSTENILIGCFKDKDGRDGYMLTNYSDPNNMYDCEVDIDFGDKTRAIVYKDGVEYIVNLVNGHYKTDIGKGAGHFVIPIA